MASNPVSRRLFLALCGAGAVDVSARAAPAAMAVPMPLEIIKRLCALYRDSDYGDDHGRPSQEMIKDTLEGLSQSGTPRDEEDTRNAAAKILRELAGMHKQDYSAFIASHARLAYIDDMTKDDVANIACDWRFGVYLESAAAGLLRENEPGMAAKMREKYFYSCRFPGELSIAANAAASAAIGEADKHLPPNLTPGIEEMNDGKNNKTRPNPKGKAPYDCTLDSEDADAFNPGAASAGHIDVCIAQRNAPVFARMGSSHPYVK